ncbi:MAG: hypothetical protein ACXVIG_04930 [Halobacteriota archaeon]
MRSQELQQFSRHCSEVDYAARNTIEVKGGEGHEKRKNSRVRIVGIVSKQRFVFEQFE